MLYWSSALDSGIRALQPRHCGSLTSCPRIQIGGPVASRTSTEGSVRSNLTCSLNMASIGQCHPRVQIQPPGRFRDTGTNSNQLSCQLRNGAVLTLVLIPNFVVADDKQIRKVSQTSLTLLSVFIRFCASAVLTLSSSLVFFLLEGADHPMNGLHFTGGEPAGYHS
jgi:hypothetical protein